MPYIVRAQNSSPVQEQVREQGVRFGRDPILKSNNRPSVNAEIFLDCIKTVFLPDLVWLRGLAEFSAEDAALLMNDSSAPVPDDAIYLLTEARVCVITFTPHTT
jgi:hypothetical protein